MTEGLCPKCGKPVDAGWAHCPACGAALGAPPEATVPSPPPARYPAVPARPPPLWSPPTGFWARGQELQKEKKVDRTKTGLLLMVGAQLLSWLPLISLVGSLLAIIGVILILLGRTAFGNRHGTNAILALVVYLIGAILAGVVAFQAGFSIGYMIARGQTGSAAADIVRNAMGTLVDALVIGLILTGIAHILLTFSLQDRTGRSVLIGGAVASALVAVYIAVVWWPRAIDAAATAAFNGTLTLTSFTQLLSDVTTNSQFLTVVPACLFALAYFLAWRRIDRGEIPAGGARMPAPPPPPPTAAAAPPKPQ